MVFLEFFEALLECALVYVTEDMIWETAAQDNQKRSSVEIKEFSKKSSAVSLTECSLPQVKLMQTCSVLLCVHLEGEVRPCKCSVSCPWEPISSSSINNHLIGSFCVFCLLVP